MLLLLLRMQQWYGKIICNTQATSVRSKQLCCVRAHKAVGCKVWQLTYVPAQGPKEVHTHVGKHEEDEANQGPHVAKGWQCCQDGGEQRTHVLRTPTSNRHRYGNVACTRQMNNTVPAGTADIRHSHAAAVSKMLQK
jgi:hypothetical protein